LNGGTNAVADTPQIADIEREGKSTAAGVFNLGSGDLRSLQTVWELGHDESRARRG
jgi:hypothetical protein